MEALFNRLFDEVRQQLDCIIDKGLEFHSKALTIVEKAIDNIRTFLQDYIFPSIEKEIFYFKFKYPQLLSMYVYHKKMKQIYLEMPQGGINSKEKHILSELNRVERYYEKNISFAQYIRSNETFFDENYFTREKAKLRPITESYSCTIDYKTNTGYDFRLSIFMAHEQLEKELTDIMKKIKGGPLESVSNDKSNNLTWTLSQSDFVELVYGIQSTKALNNGNADIKMIAEALEETFNFKVKNIYQTFSDIKDRKSENFKFIDRMKQTLYEANEDVFYTKK